MTKAPAARLVGPADAPDDQILLRRDASARWLRARKDRRHAG